MKVVLITGTSSGFGMLTAARMAASGHHVFATMRDLNKKDALLAEVKKRGGEVQLLELDVTKPDSIKLAVDKIVKECGTIDVLVNNAGYGIGGFFEDLTEEEIRRQFEVNFFGVQNVTRAVIPVMREHQRKTVLDGFSNSLPRERIGIRGKDNRAKIINISSVAGFNASPCFSAYNASKWALEAFSESLHYEMKFFGIEVLLIEPGTYPTKIFYDNARYAKNFNNPESPYYRISQFLAQKVRNYVDSCRKDPESVARLVEKLINAKNPAFRNFPDKEARTLYYLRKVLPFRVYSWMVRRMLFSGLNYGVIARRNVSQ